MRILINFFYKVFIVFFTRSDKAYGVIPIYMEDKKHFFFLGFSKSGKWVFPKGHAMIGESELAAALRELKEETGMSNCQILDSFSYFQHYHFKLLGFLPIKKTVKFYLGQVKNREVKIDNKEFKAYKWLNFKEALELVSFKSGKETLEAAERYLNG